MEKRPQFAKFDTWYYKSVVERNIYSFVVDIQSSISPPLYYGIRIETTEEHTKFYMLDNYFHPSTWRAHKASRAKIEVVAHDIMPDIKRQFIKKLIEGHSA